MKAAIFITVRTGSTRLPRKALVPVAGLPSITYVIRRMRLATKPATVVLCTTTLKEDDILCEIAQREGIQFFRGSVNDKLERWHGAATAYGIDFFVTADGDDLLCGYELIDAALEMAQDDSIDFIQAPGIICGAFTYGIRSTALKKVCEIKDSEDTEMMWVYFTGTGLFHIRSLEGIDPVYYGSDIRMTLDYPADLVFFEKVISHFESAGKAYTLKDVVCWLRANSEIPKINLHLQEAFLANQKNKTILKLKVRDHENTKQPK
jgi:spore coat polysaccharide biosynthesis protein SpsF